MSSSLKCPNPSCPYLFDPAGVPAGAVLNCPRCGMRFTLGASDFAVPSQAVPPPPPANDAKPATPAARTAAPSASRPAPEPLPPAAGDAPRFHLAIYTFVALVLVAGVGVTIYFKFAGTSNRDPGGETGSRLRDVNLGFEPPDQSWAQDEEMRVKLGSPVFLVYRHADPEAYMAFGAKDYDTRSPRPSELREGLDRPLNKLFEEIRPEPIEGATWLGQPARIAFKFHARYKGEGSIVDGSCYATTYKGIAYWSISWAGEADVPAVAGAFEQTRRQFKLLELREKWTEREVPVAPFRGHAAEYVILDAEGMWKEAPQKATDEDPNGDLLLVGTEPKRGRDKGEEATLAVFVLDPLGDPAKEGRAYIENYWVERMKLGGLKPAFQERTGEIEGDPTPNTVEPTAPVTRLTMVVPGDTNQKRLVVYSAARIGRRLVIVHAYCSWADRAIFESRLIQIAGSLREAN